MKSEVGHFIVKTVELRAAFGSLIGTFITSDTCMTWHPNQGNRVLGINQLTVVYDEFLYICSF